MNSNEKPSNVRLKNKPEILPLDQEQKEMVLYLLRNLGFLEVKCFELSVCVNQLSDFPIIGLINRDGTVWHSGVKLPNGNFFDARGELNKESFEKFEGFDGTEIREVTISELGNERLKRNVLVDENGISVFNVSRAENFVLALYPEFSENSLENRTRRFLGELQELSEKHNVWLRPAVTASKIFVANSDPDENPYYEAEPTEDGLGFIVDRKFK